MKPKTKKTGADNSNTTVKEAQIPDISITQCKNMLGSLKLGLTMEEIDIVVNSFETISISYINFMEKTMKAAQKLGDIEFERNIQLQGIVTGINGYLEKNRTKMS